MTRQEPQRAPIVGQDSIEIDAPIERVWPLIDDSHMLEAWGPPVDRVEVFLPEGAEQEGVGTRRRVHATMDGKSGVLDERRTEHVSGRRIAYVIDDDTFGIGGLLCDVGFSMELQPVGPHRTRFVFTFHQRPRGVLGWVLHPLIRWRQRGNRLAALASIKAYAESLGPELAS